MTSEGAPDLSALCADVAVELEDVSASGSGDVTTWARCGNDFARVSGSVLEARLPLDIGEAALRTPDTTPVAGERGWVRFTPVSGGRDVADRAEAWFRTAWRHADPKS
jgi:hypothetical protein